MRRLLIARGYAITVVITAVLKLAALIRYRAIRTEPRAYRMPGNVTVRGHEWPLGLVATAVLLIVAAGGLVAIGDAPSLAGFALVAALTTALVVSKRSVAAQPERPGIALDEFQLLPSDDVDLRQRRRRGPGNFLVPVRRPHVLTHLVSALRAAGDRDVVAMTVRLVGLDVPDDPTQDPRATDDERRLLSAVVAVAEREGRAVRLMIVPGVNVFDAVVETALRLNRPRFTSANRKRCRPTTRRGCSARRGSARRKPPGVDVRLVVHHPARQHRRLSPRRACARAPPEDFDQIHRLWLDVVRAVGPHVHHHDVVRAALTLMEHELNGPDREAALQLVRDTARPATSSPRSSASAISAGCATWCATGPASDLAAVLADLSLEEQVLVFRILPRKTAAETFEYLSTDEQNALLKAMA